MEDSIIDVYESDQGNFIRKPVRVNPSLPKPTYSQNWPAYDAAKTNENIFFKKLLQELLILAVEEKPPVVGRKPFDTKDKIFAMCMKSYYKADLRKCQSILKELKTLHYIEKVPCFKSIDNFFNEKELSPLLDDLILITALPLASLEETGAIDATGFSTSRFDRWFDYKWGKMTGKERVWRKAHACVGCKTNIFLSVEVTEKNVADVTMFEKVVGNKPKLFEMSSFVADKAYLARRVLEFVHNLNVVPFIPFKSNTRSLSRGVGIWHKMFYEFKDRNEEFMRKYHQRSNVETCFHMLKQRFGDSLKTKSFEANVNEIKIKVLCHNLTVLIQEVYESEIKIDFEACVKIAHPV